MMIPEDLEVLEKLKRTTLIGGREAFGVLADRSIRQTKSTSLRRIPVASGGHLLMVINHLLCLFDDLEENSYGLLQATLAKNLLPPSVLKRFGHPDLQYRPAFGRQQVLSLLKMLFKSGTGDIEPVRDLTTNERYALGKALINTTDFMQPPESKSLEEAITSLAPVFELYNPPLIDIGLAHTVEFLARLDEVAPGYRTELDGLFKEGTGLNIGFLLEATGLLYLMFLGPTIVAAEETLSNLASLNWRRSKAFINLPQFEDNLEAFFNLNSIDFGQLQSVLQRNSETDLRETNDFIVFRQTPIVNLDDDIFTCIDVKFLLEKVSFGFFRTLFNALPSDSKRPNKKDAFAANKLNTNWALAIEGYVSSLLSSQTDYFPDVRFSLDRSRQEQIDGVGMFCDSAAILETKGRFLSASSKYSMDGKLIEELNQKFGREHSDRDKGAVFQLVRDLQVLFDKTKFPTVNLDMFSRAEDLHNAKRIYPILVVEESLLRFDLIQHLLRRWFDEELRDQGGIAGREVLPLCVLSIEVLERIEPYLKAGVFRFVDFLRYFGEMSKSGAAPARLATNRILADFIKKNGFERLSNKRVEKVCDDFMSKLMDKLKINEGDLLPG